MFNKIIKALGVLEKQVSKMPFMAIACFIATTMVLNVPIQHLLHPPIYSNEIYASIIVPSLPIISNLLLAIHIAAAIPAIVIAPFLFVPAWRVQYPHIHRRFGKIYILSCLISATTILPVATRNSDLLVSEIGFSAMATCWFFMTWMAYNAARNKSFIAHRRWIMRSYAMTFAFIHVNLTYLLIYSFLDDIQIKVMQSMVSWMTNLLIVEIYLAGTSHTGKFLGFKKWFHNLSSTSKLDKFHWRHKTA